MKNRILLFLFIISFLTINAQNSFPSNNNILIDNHSIISPGGSSIGFGNSGIGNENDDITIDIVNDGEFELSRGNINLLSIGSQILLDQNNTRKVGIGVKKPTAKLEVKGNIKTFSDTENLGKYINILGGKSGNFIDSHKNHLFFRIDANNSKSLIIKQNGNVGIGVSSTSKIDSKLTVAGDIHSREVKVTIDAGADFVFENNYNLPSLKEVETYIFKNKHLPEIDSAKEMKSNGLKLAEMNIKLLQKIEELTIYTINQEKKIEDLKGLNNKLLELQTRIDKLESQK